jgi:phenylacetate-CoA ligase
MQNQAVDELLRWATHEVPYYQSLAQLGGIDISRAGGIERLQAFPLLDKSAIRTAGDSMFARSLPRSRGAANATSGSTGESLRFYVDMQTKSSRAAATYRFYRWCGASPVSKHAKLWGARFDEQKSDDPRSRLRRWMHPELFLSSYRLAEHEMEEYAQRLLTFRPALLTSYPSPLEHFARYCRDRRIVFPSLRAIITSAEQLLQDQRRLVEEVFGVPIFDRYGSREFGNVAQECERHDGLHVAIDNVFLEVVDQNGRPCAPGSAGEVIITDLRNLFMPFLRYRTGDIAVLSGESCRCGRSLPRLVKLEGRVFELIRTPSGQTISGTFWPQVVKQVSVDVRNFQVRQDRGDHVRILLETFSGLPVDDECIAALEKRILQFAPDLAIDVEHVAEIPLSRAGKRLPVIVETGAQGRPK